MEPLTNISGLSNIYFVRVATTANLTATYSSGPKTLTNSGANAALSIDGVTLSVADKVLVKNQSTGSQNGLYTVTTVGDGSTPWVLTRSTDMDTATEAEERDWFWITEGTVNADNGYALSTPGTITLDTTSLTFTRMLGSATGSGQPASAALTDLDDVGVVSAADKFHYSTATGVWAEGTVTAAGRAILDDATAADQRTTLGLGTAAVANTGTSAGNIPILDGSGRLPAVNASQLTDLALYPADVWDYEWNASAGTTMETDGWTKVGAITDTSTTIGGYTARLLTPTANSGAAYMSKVISGSAPNTGLSIYGSFELRVLCVLPASTSASIVHALAFCMQSGGNQFIPAVTSTALWASSGSGTLTSLTLTAGLPNRSVWITIRCANGLTSGSVAGTSYTEVWLGGIRIWTGVSTTPWASFSGGNEGLFRIGRIVGPGSGGNVEAVKVASIKWRAGWNAAPVNYTMRSLYGAPGP